MGLRSGLIQRLTKENCLPTSSLAPKSVKSPSRTISDKAYHRIPEHNQESVKTASVKGIKKHTRTAKDSDTRPDRILSPMCSVHQEQSKQMRKSLKVNSKQQTRVENIKLITTTQKPLILKLAKIKLLRCSVTYTDP